MARSHAGGIARAAALLDEHGGAIEADLLRYYGLEVGDFPWPLTPRKLLVLVSELPEDSAYARSALGLREAAWTLGPQLWAVLIDELRGLNHQIALLRGVQRLKPPEPFPRPGVAPAKQRASVADVRALLSSRGLAVPDELLRGGRR